MAATFGASGITDAFTVAYRVPNMLRDLFAEGAFGLLLDDGMAKYMLFGAGLLSLIIPDSEEEIIFPFSELELDPQIFTYHRPDKGNHVKLCLGDPIEYTMIDRTLIEIPTHCAYIDFSSYHRVGKSNSEFFCTVYKLAGRRNRIYRRWTMGSETNYSSPASNYGKT